MDKTYKDELHRLFLIQDLPEPLTRASSHLQIFDNYIENTRMRLRAVRVPETKEWTHILQQRFPAENLRHWKFSEIYLNEAEYEKFQTFEGREIRKNRYFYEYNDHGIEIDVYLGALWGLNTAKIVFENEDEWREFKAPPFAVVEVTNDLFFYGETLVEKNFADVQREVAGILKRKSAAE